MEKKTFAATIAHEAFALSIPLSIRRAMLLGCCVSAFFLFASRDTLSQDELVWSGPGCVLLKNGNVLQANSITTKGKQVAIRLDQTGEVNLSSKDIAAIGRDNLELYQHQVKVTTHWETGEHWNLAKWCLRHGLIKQSFFHYEKLKELSGDHSKFKQLDAELKQALLQDPVMKAALKTVYPSASVEAASFVTLNQSTSESNTNPKRAAADSTTLPQNQSAKTFGVNRVAQDYFRQHIQPFLVMRCGQAGCHGAFGKSEFQITKSGSLHGQRAVDVGFTSTARFLDQESVEATKLWIQATTAHGMQKAPSLTIQDPVERELLNRIQLWHQAIYRTAQTATTAKPDDALAFAPATVIALKSSANAKTMNSQVQNPDSLKDITAGSLPTNPASLLPEVRGDLLALEREIAKLEVKELARKTPNRHDPEEFNRRYGRSSP